MIKRGKFGLPENEEALDRDKRFVNRLNRVVDKYISTVDEFSFYTIEKNYKYNFYGFCTRPDLFLFFNILLSSTQFYVEEYIDIEIV